MTTKPLYTPPHGALKLYAAILDEVIEPQIGQMSIDELGLVMATHLGVKRGRNEDRVAVARITAANFETYTVVLACDGVGGTEFGDQAAAYAIASVIADLVIQKGSPSAQDLAVSLVKRADDLVRKEFKGRGATTLVMLLAMSNGDLVCANVGDSRAYSWDPSSSNLEQVTIDDTIENELKSLPGNHDALLKARGLQGRLSQAIGESERTADELRIQTYTKEHFRFGAILGTDGLWRAARDFEAAVAKATTPNEAAKRAIVLAGWVGGVDNSSLIAISDVQLLYGNRYEQDLVGTRKMGVSLWVPSTKVKLFGNDKVEDVSRPKLDDKREKQKRPPKRREPRSEKDEPQLKLEPVTPKEAKPRIEVTISETSKSGDGGNE